MKYIWISLLILLHPLVNAQPDVFKTATPLDAGRQMYGTVVVGEYLYVIGGNMEPDVYTRTVMMAHINPDGTLDSWEKTTPLPEPRCYIHNTTVVLNNMIYVIQGLNGDSMEKKRTIYYTRPRQDGQLQDWQESGPCPVQGVANGVAVATPGSIHLIGGSKGSSIPVSNVWSVRIFPDGRVVEWIQGPPLPQALWFHCGGLALGKVWIWGGLTTANPSSASDAVYAAPVLDNGLLGPWEESSSKLKDGFYSASSTVLGDYLFAFCPRNKTTALNGDIWYANVVSGDLSEWKRIDCEVPAKLYNAVATDFRLGIIYLPGGRYNKETLNLDKNVYYFTLAMGEHGGDQSPGSIFVKAQSPAPQESPALPSDQTPQTVPPSRTVIPVYTLPGFLPFETAKQAFALKPRPTLIYFHSKMDQACQDQARFLSGFQGESYASRVILAEVDRENFSQIFLQYQVTQVPLWLVYDARGNLIARSDRVLQNGELTQALNSMAP